MLGLQLAEVRQRARKGQEPGVGGKAGHSAVGVGETDREGGGRKQKRD